MHIYHTVPASPNVTLREVNSTNVSISWIQDSQDTYDNFTVSYTYDGPCNIGGISTINHTTESNIMKYTITSLEEFSNYTLVVYAVNSAGRSLRTISNTVKFKTETTGIPDNTVIIVITIIILAYLIILAPSGQPRSLRVGSSNLTSIHILWDRISCTERNGEIIGYNITYYPTMYGGVYKKYDYVEGTSEANRQYIAIQLTPITQYEFIVRAVSSHNRSSFSLAATDTFHTNGSGTMVIINNFDNVN